MDPLTTKEVLYTLPAMTQKHAKTACQMKVSVSGVLASSTPSAGLAADVQTLRFGGVRLARRSPAPQGSQCPRGR